MTLSWSAIQTIPTRSIRLGATCSRCCSNMPRKVDRAQVHRRRFPVARFPRDGASAYAGPHRTYRQRAVDRRGQRSGPSVSDREHDALIAYTISRPWPHAAGRPGVISFSSAEAAELGQRRGFVLHLWRVARLPVIPAWFPRLSAADAGVVGRASTALRLRLADEAARVFARHVDTVERLGPGSLRR